MRVKELIEELQKLPQDSRVWSQNEIGDLGYDILVELDVDHEVMVTSQ